MSKEKCNILSYSNNLLEKKTSKLGYDFYNNNLRKVMNDDRFDGNKKYIIAKDILNIYVNIIKDILRYKDRILILHQSILMYDDYSKVMIDMIDLNKSLINYINNKKSYLKSFNINRYVFKKISKISHIKKYPDADDQKQVEMFGDLLEDLYEFRSSQLDLFDSDKYYLYHKSLKNSDIIYHDVFENIIDRYIKRLYYIELEIIKIKYANRININNSLYYAKNDIYEYILKCQKNDNISLISKENNICKEVSL